MAMNLRIDDELDAALTDLAASEGLSKHEIIRRAVLERHERAGHRAEVDRSSDRLIEHWSDVLDRLGSV